MVGFSLEGTEYRLLNKGFGAKGDTLKGFYDDGLRSKLICFVVD